MQLQLRDIKHTRERYIYPMLSAKLLTMTNPEHPLSRSQKFKTTKLGATAIELYRNSDVVDFNAGDTEEIESGKLF